MLPTTVLNTIEKATLVSPGDCVLVAFSGGPDSTALLHVLHELRDDLEIDLVAAHLNHLLRGLESDGDEAWCAEFAGSLGIDFHSRRLDVRAENQRRNGNLEETARELRYDFLERTADEFGAQSIAVGHTADDQAETVLLRLLRGAGSGGLRGMRLRRGRIIRPLLEAGGGDVLDYLASKNLGHRSDSSNREEKLTRVFLRRRVVPLLRELNPSLEKTISTSAAILSEEDDFLNEVADGVIRDIELEHPGGLAIDAESFASLHPALQRRVLRRILARGRGDLRSIEYRSIEAMRRCALSDGPGVDLDNLAFVKHDHLLILRPKDERTGEPPAEFRYTAAAGQTIRVKEVDKSFALRNIEASDGVETKKLSGPGRVLLDADAAGETLEVRNWLPGDRYRPLGSPGRQKLQDIFINSGIPRRERISSVVFLAGGRICWVSGLRVSEDFKVIPETSRILVIEEVKDG
ncbi:MAG TPA: tRNA lysidine(34) synthetase TilS [Acidobacteriota bacterium]|nr:tRNA lysidine(34) synthetase TilS [Acidobacteriota bacterium]